VAVVQPNNWSKVLILQKILPNLPFDTFHPDFQQKLLCLERLEDDVVTLQRTAVKDSFLREK